VTADPRDVVVVGAPRSGTSMLAGLFAAAGYHAGRRLIPPTPSNPAGFFEDLDVNAANDDLLDAVADRPVAGTEAPPRQLRWLGAYEGRVDEAADRPGLATLVPDRPFALKDPRFCYTLPAWRGVLGDALVVVIVRRPDEVVASVRAMAGREPETFAGFDVSERHIRAMWDAMYRSVLAWCDGAGAPETTFVACDDVRDGTALRALRTATGADLDAGAVRADLHRERRPGETPEGLLAELLGRCAR
jgi:hypothetical protein